ncbi:MAG: hypothetical protein HY698_09890 [Deltaproteobacteria bacterium]|nr:hypothetical protein [Deltaproteobacteria bacterium]
MQYKEAVVLIPGFLGFGRLGGFYYFADRVASMLRGALEERLGTAVPVVPVPTLPTGALVDRQRALGRYLGRLACKAGIDRFHLVGHSTGGVDAQLFSCTEPLSPSEPWKEIDPMGARDRIASVVTIGSPHFGTCMTESPVSRFLRHPRPRPRQLAQVASLVRALGPVVARDPTIREAAAGASSATWEAWKFLSQAVRDRRLLSDLTPCAMARHRETKKLLPHVRVTCFAVVAAVASDGRRADPFFHRLHLSTALGAGACDASAEVEEALRRLSGLGEAQVIKSPRTSLPTLDLGANDGIVNTSRQVLPDAALGGLVVADHADVLGHYERRDPLRDDQPISAGLLHSGSAFGDDEFFTLYARVADAIVPHVASPTTRGRPFPRREATARID